MNNPVHIQTTIGFDCNGMPVSIPIANSQQIAMMAAANTSGAQGIPLSIAASASPASSVGGMSAELNVSPSSQQSNKGQSNRHHYHRETSGHHSASTSTSHNGAGSSSTCSGGTNTSSVAEYLQQLIKERSKLGSCPGMYIHCERLIDVGKFLKLCYF